MLSPVSTNSSSRAYLEGLWFTMHHSYAPGRQTYTLSSYFDDSGSDDLSPMTTIGGPVMSKDAFLDFQPAWAKILDKYQIPQPMHMIDFVRPHGKHIGMHREMKLALFRAISDVINDHKLYSLSVSVAQWDFDLQLSVEVRSKLIGPYAMAFFTAVLGNQGFSERTLVFPAEQIAYLIDIGFPHSDQLHSIHRIILNLYEGSGRSCFVGSLTEESDHRVAALQAADVIAWASRRRELNALTEEYAPLHRVIRDDCSHAHIPLPLGGIKMFSNPINKWLATGVLPRLEDIITMKKL